MAGSQGGNVYTAAANGMNQAGALTGMAGNYNPGTVNPMMNTAQGIGGMTSQFMNPYLSNVANRALSHMNDARLQQINQDDASATAAGAFGGSRHGIANATTNQLYQREVGDMVSGLYNQGYNNAQNAAMGLATANQNANLQAQLANQNAGLQANQHRLAAGSQLGQLSNMGFGMGRQITADQSAQGNLLRGLNQAVIDAGRNQYNSYSQWPLATAGLLGQAFAGTNPGSMTTQSSTPGLYNYMGLGAGLLGSAMQAGLFASAPAVTAGPAALAFASDIALKKNIEQIGELPSGLAWYRWDWNEEAASVGLHGSDEGVIAQEAQALFPDAVTEMQSGYLGVNYAEIH
jgi:hypothetical protein